MPKKVAPEEKVPVATPEKVEVPAAKGIYALIIINVYVKNTLDFLLSNFCRCHMRFLLEFMFELLIINVCIVEA